MKTLVMGIGNILRGDDGVGSAVIEALQAQTLPEDVELLDAGTPGFEMVLLMQGYDRVLVVDAADMGCTAGEWRVFSRDEVQLQARDMYLRGTLHYAGLAEALNLGAALNLLPQEIIIFGIQPERIDWHQGVSPTVAQHIPTTCEAVLATLAEQPVTSS